MKGEALIFMLLSWMLICSLSTFCFTMLFVKGEEQVPKRKEKTYEEFPEEIT